MTIDKLTCIDDMPDVAGAIQDLPKYNYQTQLTAKLDTLTDAFDQNIINEIVLWKVNRYAMVDDDVLSLINKIDNQSTTLDEKLTREVLQALLTTKGIALPMASTILRFKNPKVYQIIDQRVYRILYGEKLKITSKVDAAIDLYLAYLRKLKAVCTVHHIDYELADRVFYSLDQHVNKQHKIDY